MRNFHCPSVPAILLFGSAFLSAGAYGQPIQEAKLPAYDFMTKSGLTPFVQSHYISKINYYVSDTKGSDTNAGTIRAPWKTITHAIAALSDGADHGGVCVNVEPGVYTGTFTLDEKIHGSNDAPAGYLVFRSTTPRQAKIMQPDSGSDAIVISYSHHIIIDGFEVAGCARPGCRGSGVKLINTDHIQVLNCMLHDVAAAGIGGIFSDHFTVRGNIVYRACGFLGPDIATSAISFYEPVARDSTPGFHNFISNNICFDNSELQNGRPAHSEGHGIICDDFLDQQKNNGVGPYKQKTLVENNLLFDNGGAGINIFYSDYITVRNNTAYHNVQDPLINYSLGDISVYGSSYDTVVNNIGVATVTPGKQTPALNDVWTDAPNIGNVWKNNLAFDGVPGDNSVSIGTLPATTTGGQVERTVQAAVSNGGTPITAANNNILGKDPQFVSASTGNYMLRPNSPARLGGTTDYGSPAFGLGGYLQTDPPTIGAYTTDHHRHGTK
jgi:parallel beta-helix repeat protein